MGNEGKRENMVRFTGKITRREVNELYGKSRAGIVCYQPLANHMEAQPIKMFEYMAAGLPVIASNFPLWKKIIEENGCGICVDPTSAQEVRRACEKLVNDPQSGQRMGKNGREAVMEKYNWGKEEQKLILFYGQILEMED